MLWVLVAEAVQGSAAPDTISVERAIERAMRARGAVVSTAAAVSRARASARRETAVPSPLVQFEAAGSAPTRALQVTQPLSWLLGWDQSRTAGNAQVRGAAADSVQSMATLAREARLGLYTAVAAGEALKLVRQQASAAETLFTLASRRLALGDISELERDQVGQELATVRLMEQRGVAEARLALLELGRALGGAVPEGAVLDATLDEGLTGTPPGAAPGLADVGAVAGMPSLVAAVEDSAAAAARASLARWRQFPLPALLGKWEWGGGPGAPRNGIVGFSVPLPLWHLGRHDVALARAEALEFAGAAAEARTEASRRLDAARVRVEETAARARGARDDLYPSAQRIRAGAVRLFEAGRTGILPVFEAFRREREAAAIMIQELLAFQTARADMLALTGRVR